MTKRYQYDRQGFLALNPRAFLAFFEPAGAPEIETRDGVAIVPVRGPLEHHAGWYCDSYDALRERVAAALASNAHTIVLQLDSPGGEVSGMIDTARDLNAAIKASGKRSVSFVSGQAASAAYALAVACDEIVVTETSFVGSIGVISTRVDVTAADAAMGLKFALLTSGARKADGNPHQAVSDAELAETQGTVDSLADVFFAWVQERRGVDAAPLNARVFHGAKAVAAKLADRVASFDSFLASLTSGAELNGEKMASKYEEARAALEEAAKSDDKDEAARAKKALAAMDDKDPDAESDEPPADDEEKDDKDATRAVAAPASGLAAELAVQLQTVSARLQKMEAKNESDERAAFLATRPDLAPELLAVLKSKPIADVKALVNAMPKPATPTGAELAASGTTLPATRGLGQGDTEIKRDGDSSLDEMNARMGVTKFGMGVVEKNQHAISFGVRAEKK